MAPEGVNAERPFDAVAVETNWVLDVALHQDRVSEELLVQAEEGLVQVLLPSFCIAEAIKRFDSIREQWIALERAIKTTAREIMRSPHLSFSEERLVSAAGVLSEVSGVAEGEFWRLLEQITRITRLIEPQPGIVAATADIRTFLGLEPSDASVLATISAARKADMCRKFMSRDKDFGADDVLAYMVGQGLEYFDNPLPIIGPLRRHRA